MKASRIEGIRRLCNALIPVLCLLLFLSILLDLRGMYQGPVRNINASFTNVAQVVEDEAKSLSDTFVPISDVSRQIKNMTQEIQAIPEQVEIPSLKIPDISLPLKPVITLSQSSPMLDGSVALEQIQNNNISWVETRPSSELTHIGMATSMMQPALAIFDVIRDAVDEVIPKEIPSLPTLKPQIRLEDVQITMPALPQVTVALPGIVEIKDVLVISTKSLDVFNDILATIPDLTALEEHLQELSNLIQGILHKVRLLAWILTFGVICSISFWLSAYIAWSRHQMTTGWSLLWKKSL